MGSRARPPATWSRIRPRVRPDGRFGQNFILDPELLEREVAWGEVRAGDRVLEIGPGFGTLTERLARVADRLTCIEIDRQFRPHLEALADRYGNIDILWGDARSIPLPDFDRVVANLPFRVSLPIIFRLLEQRFTSGLLVIQHRQARRITAARGQEGYGRISVSVQRLASTRLLEVIGREKFYPPPDVDAAALRIEPRADPFPVPDEESFKRLLDLLFLTREEPIGGALKRLTPRKRVNAVIASLPPLIRETPVALSTPAEFGLIARAVAEAGVPLPEVSEATKRKAQKSDLTRGPGRRSRKPGRRRR